MKSLLGARVTVCYFDLESVSLVDFVMEHKQTINTMWENTIVAYIDVMGYKRVVDELIHRTEIIEQLEELFYGLSVNAVKELAELDLKDAIDETDTEIQDYFKKVADTIRVRCISDSFVFTLPVSEVNFRCKEYDERATIGNCIQTYFGVIRMFSQLFICKTGCLLRGGISIGKHYESERTNQLFVFSQAHNRACEIEKAARTPRIVIDESLRSYLNGISSDFVSKFFYRDDEGGCLCLDIYKGLCSSPRKEGILREIAKCITLNTRINWDNKKELGKVIAFAKYHNRWVNSESLNFPASSIADIAKYEERYKFLKSQKNKHSKRK